MKRPHILLAASLVLNIFLLGAIGGGVWHWSHAQSHLSGGGGGAGQGWRMRAADALPPGDAAAFRQALRATIRDAQPVVAQSRDARAQAAALFAAAQFDRAATLAQLDRARAADFALRQRLERRIVELAAALPPSERAALAAALHRAPRRERRRLSLDGTRREAATAPVKAAPAGDDR